jgi:hypothetical protein
MTNDRFAGLVEGRFLSTTPVDAKRWNPEDPQLVLAWLEQFGCRYHVFPDGRLGIGTLESGDGLDSHAAKPLDWILHDGLGDFWVHDAALFQQRYQVAE